MNYTSYELMLSSLNINYGSGSLEDVSCSMKLQPHRPKFCSSNISYLMVILLLAGDTEQNPGHRPVKCPCVMCKAAAKCGQNCIQCEQCSEWFHIECMNMPLQEYETYASSSSTWFCNQCGQPNISLPGLQPMSDSSTSNFFSVLEDTLVHEELGDPVAASSPTKSPDSHNTFSRRRHNLKYSVINCDDLCNKMPQLELFIDDHKPDVIIITESHLKDHIFTAEITPLGFTAFRTAKTINPGTFHIIIMDTTSSTSSPLALPPVLWTLPSIQEEVD